MDVLVSALVDAAVADWAVVDEAAAEVAGGWPAGAPVVSDVPYAVAAAPVEGAAVVAKVHGEAQSLDRVSCSVVD